MNTLLFLAGCGCGALVATIFLLIALNRNRSIRDQMDANHRETMAQFAERNRLLAEQNKIQAEIKDAIDPL